VGGVDVIRAQVRGEVKWGIKLFLLPPPPDGWIEKVVAFVPVVTTRAVALDPIGSPVKLDADPFAVRAAAEAVPLVTALRKNSVRWGLRGLAPPRQALFRNPEKDYDVFVKRFSNFSHFIYEK
jgi:hypothetical protein